MKSSRKEYNKTWHRKYRKTEKYKRFQKIYKKTAMEKQRIRSHKNRIEAIKSRDNKCKTCGETDYRTFQWHHLKGKDICTSSIANSTKKFWKEVSKCILVCANCHARIHFKEYTDLSAKCDRLYKKCDSPPQTTIKEGEEKPCPCSTNVPSVGKKEE